MVMCIYIQSRMWCAGVFQWVDTTLIGLAKAERYVNYIGLGLAWFSQPP